MMTPVRMSSSLMMRPPSVLLLLSPSAVLLLFLMHQVTLAPSTPPATSKSVKHAKKGGKTSKLEEAVHSMVERIKTSYAMDRQLATLLGQMSSQTTDP